MSMRNALDHISAALDSEIASRSNRYADNVGSRLIASGQ
ncbi:hypothetical protein D8I24_5512 [Cupriavidus necator H850]|jgi:hypothetical protein|nr:hypothetical protein D8I24_5512 [Cupriavidus necator H850]